MAFPTFYDPAKVGTLYLPDTHSAIQAGYETQIAPAESDAERIVLLLVDMQVDFIHADGNLSVPGAIDDTRRTIEWIFNNIERLTSIAASLDSHLPIQIFSPTWWVNAAGEHPQPFTVISNHDVQAGTWQAIYEPDWSKDYVRKLESSSKKQLMIWPYHTLIGTPGHSLTPALYEAIAYHSAARNAQPQYLTKGTIPKTEHYSMLEPEVKVPGVPHGGLNTDFLNMLATYDRIYVAGQAKSHCVLETVSSMMRYFASTPEFIDKIYLLTDATSSVAHPEIDFEAIANDSYSQFEQNGLHLVTTQDAV